MCSDDAAYSRPASVAGHVHFLQDLRIKRDVRVPTCVDTDMCAYHSNSVIPSFPVIVFIACNAAEEDF